MAKTNDKVKINVEFNEASTRENINSKESLNTIFGKIRKIISDLHTSAFTGNAETVNNHKVESDVPADAVFTDTTYDAATSSSDGLMTSSDKTKLEDIEDGAEKNVISEVQVNGTKVEPENGVVNLTVSGSGTGSGSSDDKLPLTGGVVTGNVQQSGPTTDYTTYKFRNIAFGTTTTPPTDANFGGNGSIYFYYK